MLDLMLPALVASLILVGMHGYLGIHIIARGVIFVDLAIAQVAAMGWAASSLGITQAIHGWIGIPEGVIAYGVGVAATLIAAWLFSITRTEHKYIPQEAIIGIVFVVASAGTILLAAQSPRGAEHVEGLLTGNLLWVTWPQILRMAIIYAAIGVVHWLWRARFFVISLQPDQAAARKWNLGLWDFAFYALFGIVVTASVEIAGVLIVFSSLVIPAVVAFLFTTSPGPLLFIAWVSGTVAVLFGLLASYQTDLPTGPMVVCSYALVLLAGFGVNALRQRLAVSRIAVPKMQSGESSAESS